MTVEKTRQRAPWAPTSILRAGVALRNVVVETFRGFRADRGLDLAGSLAFATLLLAVPLLATFSLLLATFFQENVDEILDLANRAPPFPRRRACRRTCATSSRSRPRSPASGWRS